MFEFKLPDLGEGIQEGEILEWFVNEGENIEEDALLVRVETDKAAVEIPSPRSGTVVKQNGKAGDIVEVGNVLVIIDDGSSTEAAPAETQETPVKQASAEPTGTQPVAVPSVRNETGPVPAAPATRRLARELGVDINTIAGTGTAGRVTPDDVKAVAEGKAPAAAAPQVDSAQETPQTDKKEQDTHADTSTFEPVEASGIPFFELEAMPDFDSQGPVEREAIRSIRRKVAKKMTTSMVVVPHVAHMDEADVTDLEEFRLRERSFRKDEPGGRLTLLPFVTKAMTRLLKRYPSFNASIDPFKQEIVYKKYYNVGFAADTPRGLVVPVVKNADTRSILEISAEIASLAEQARDGKIDVSDLRGSTFSITNVGPIGGTGLIPTINYPEVAILGMGPSAGETGCARW